MIIELAARGKRSIACFMLSLLYFEIVIPFNSVAARNTGRDVFVPVSDSSVRRKDAVTPAPFPAVAVKSGFVAPKPPDIGGPTQPESQAFHSVNSDNMVDLFSGDFSYSIPLLDVGGYPVAIGYNSGISMDQEASWVGLGWNINPGTITRNLRGIPDDFNGTDTINKTVNVKPSKTVGITVGADMELAGLPKMKQQAKDSTLKLSLSLSASIGVTHSNYKGFGIESGLNASINVGAKNMGKLTSGLSFTNSSQQGITVGTSVSWSVGDKEATENLGNPAASVSSGFAANTRTGLKALTFSAGMRQYGEAPKNNPQQHTSIGTSVFDSEISFAHPSFTPTITMPYTSSLISVTAKVGGLVKILDGHIFASGYVAKQGIEPQDRKMSIPAYGYLNYQNAEPSGGSLLDYNREKDMPYREKPEVPNIAIPSYTYDVFSISGEGTGGMFRAYRGDIGYVYDHRMKTKDKSGRFSADLGVGDLVHWGVDLNMNRSYTENGPWKSMNPLASLLAFRKSDKQFEAAYFRNPGEKSVNAKAFYDNIGGDDVVAVELYQSSKSSPYITPTNILNRYVDKKRAGQVIMNADNVYKKARDKRTQVISYLTAEEASTAGLSKYIDNYNINTYGANNCQLDFPTDGDTVHGLLGQYFSGQNFEQFLFSKVDTMINYLRLEDFNAGKPIDAPSVVKDFSVRWTGKLKPDVTGTYKIVTHTDDGVRLFINDSMFINHWGSHGMQPDTATVNMIAGEMYNIRLEYYQARGKIGMQFRWMYAGLPLLPIQSKNLWLMPSADTFTVGNGQMSREKRINDFRKKNHISEINVLNSDGRRYVYGIPVYNLKQKDVTFSVDAGSGNPKDGLVKYTPGVDNTVDNNKGLDHYFNKEEVPAYAHSFLLTGLLSADYVDRTGDGISDDDLGDAVKFNYSKVAGIKNPYKWRTPYTDSAAYNEGLRTDNRDDRGSYVYGEKELWYLNSIESKNMIATFKLSDRDDQPSIDEDGHTSSTKVLKKLDEINLYVKADYRKDPLKARPVKTVHFEYGYDLCGGVVKGNNKGKLTLKRVWFTYNGNNKTQRNPYVFNYNAHNPSYNIKSYDRWGNYKDPLQNPGSSKDNLLTNAEYPYSLQDSTLAANNAAAWTLDSIVLPSGGRMKIDYESDDYAFVQNRRAAQMFKIAGLSDKKPEKPEDLNTKLYGGLNEYLFVSVNLPKPVSSNSELYSRYLEGLDTLFFKLNVKMPADKFGSGNEYVSCYANMEPGTFGYYNNGQTMWVKMKAITQGGEADKIGSIYSPLAKASIQYLRLNLPSKAYPGSDVGDDIDLGDAVKVLLSQATNVLEMLTSFDNLARAKGWANQIDTSRSFVRLNSPYYKKYGGGLRVKRIRIYDHWNAMTKQRESIYGQEYQYTTTRTVNGVDETISSGVATFEPAIGGEENPWRLPIAYKEQVAVLAPIGIGYTEKPLGETFYPAPSVGYSKVRVRTINAKNVRSANGYNETGFYTSYDFPTQTDMTMLADGKKRYKPTLSNFLRINACHFVAVSQGFKVEVNDMNGKLRWKASYSESDPKIPISYSENFYKVDNQNATFKHLNNTVMAIDEQGVIDSAASIGKDIELMLDMREQHSVTNALNLNLNGDNFTFPFPPVFLLPTLWNLAQREETKFQSIGATKIVNRHGILDSVLVIEKGSRVSTRNLLFDAETGDPVLTRTYNEFDDPVYSFTMPAAWVYNGMSGAYKNINTTLSSIYINQGKIVKGLDTLKTAADYFTSGDEILIASKPKTGGSDCDPEIATFRSLTMLYAVDANLQKEGAVPDIYFVDRNGVPFTGNDLKMKVVRSGRRNIAAQAGQFTSLNNPLTKNAGVYSLSLDNNRTLNSDVVTFDQFWKVEDNLKAATVMNCVPMTYAEYSDSSNCGTFYYSNTEVSRSLQRTNCGKGFAAGAAVTYIVPAGSYSSEISQEDADAKAQADLAMNAQDYANTNGVCIPYYYSAPIDKDFQRQCNPGGVGSIVTYHHPAATDSSLVSQAQADTLAMARANTLGQAYANANGICTYSSTAVSDSIRKNDCPQGSQGTIVKVVIPAGAYTSTTSLADANTQAQEAAQDSANAKGICIPVIDATFSESCSDRNCTEQGIPTLTFVFPSATTTEIVLLFGTLENTANGILYTGSDIFTPPANSKPGGFLSSNLPYIVRIPAGVTSYSTSGSLYQQGHEGNNIYGWSCHSCQRKIIDFYIKSLNAGYKTDLKYINSTVNIHNL